MSHIKSMQRKKKTKARIFTIGLGSDVDNAFLQQLSRHFDGSATAVPAESQTQMAQDIKGRFKKFSVLFCFAPPPPQLSEHKSFMNPRRTCYFLT